MKRLSFVFLMSLLYLTMSCAQESTSSQKGESATAKQEASPAVAAQTNDSAATSQPQAVVPQTKTTKIILLISEQNIEGPQRAWWASQIDLSTTETGIAKKLIEQGYEILDPSSLSKIIQQKPAFQIVDISEGESISLGSATSADYIILGKAIATAGGNAPQSNMRSCFANVTAKLVRVSDSKVVQYLDASGSSIHTDVITGGREALEKASEGLAQKIVETLNREKSGGK
ncbi:MAG: hypothetical protein PHV55_04110 [Candidatus Omnitrophica bacterium]|nr:hypothetical protein [Candidatus Omnitrophota bacterium]